MGGIYTSLNNLATQSTLNCTLVIPLSLQVNMTTPISFTVRPPNAAPHRPSPLGNGGGRSGPPSRRFFEQNNGDDEDEDDHEEDHHRHERRSRPREERIEGFGKDGKALGFVFHLDIDRTETNRGQKAEGPMVIPALPNRDWRQSTTRRTPSYRPDEKKRDNGEDTKPDRIGDEPQRSGLRFAVKREVVEDIGEVEVKQEQEESVNINGDSTSTTTTRTTTVKTEPVDPSDAPKPMTLEEQALQAILAGDQSIESDAARAQREMVIQSEADRLIQPMSETDALQRDLDALPEESTRDDYQNVPIEAFGMAMLRGMGWNPKDESNTKIHIPKARPGQLGLGATPMSEIIPPSHDKKSKREDKAKRGGRGFNASGIMIKKEINGDGSGSVTPAGSGSSRRPSPDYDSEASKRRRRDDDYDSSRESRRRDGNRDHDRDRGGDRYETEDERARRKAKERERERGRDDRDRDRNRDRERYPNGDKDRYSDRDRYEDRDRRDRRRDDKDRR
jgi:hypothetical protein